MSADQLRAIARMHLDVAHALYEQRERAGVTVAQLAERTGLAADRIVMIEEGDTTSLTEIAQICVALGLSLIDVMPGRERYAEAQGKAVRLVSA